MKKFFAVCCCVVMFNIVTQTVLLAKGDPEMIAAGKTVKFDYVLTVDGEKVDSSEQSGPFEYMQGHGKIIPGLEKQMEGLLVGDKKTITVPADEAYGQIDPSAFQEVPKTEFPADISLEAGQMLTLKAADGNMFPAVISAVKDEAVILDFNHPLAGKTLQFQVTVIDIR